MADLSDLKFPEKLPGLTFYDGDEWMGGIDWLATGTPGRCYRFEEVRMINLGDYFSASELGNPNIERFADLVTLPNNAKVKIRLKFIDASSLGITAQLFDTDGETWIQDLGNFATSSSWGYLPSFSEYYIYCFCSTRYTNVPTEGVTPPDQAGIYCLIFNNQSTPFACSVIAPGNEVSTLQIREKAVSTAAALTVFREVFFNKIVHSFVSLWCGGSLCNRRKRINFALSERFQCWQMMTASACV